MPIIDLQRRARELGRIRIGQVVKAGRSTRPTKLDRFRITAASRDLLDKIAALYGGTVQEWTPQNSKLQQWEVLTEATRLPVLVPPQPVSQWYETWSGGGCLRRCDGVREVLSDKPCLCGPDPAERGCKPTTRLNVVLREVEGIGVFRLETHGYYAAVELPSAAELLAAANGYISGHLALEERVVKRNGETRRFMVPTLDVDMTPGQLMSGGATAAVEGGPRPALAAAPAPPAAEPAALPAAPSKPRLSDEEQTTLLAQIADTDDVDAIRAMWRDACSAYHIDGDGPVALALRNRAAELTTGATPPEPDPGEAGAADPDDAPSGDPEADADAAWAAVMRAAPEDWSTSDVEHDFAQFAGLPAEQAGAPDMRAYVKALPDRVKGETA